MVTKLCDGLHQLRIDFQVTPEIRRFAYIYLIEGASCYLVDSGVGESEKAIFSYMEGIGRKPEEIKGIFLTHAHPDHIGSAARIKELTGCTVCASRGNDGGLRILTCNSGNGPSPISTRWPGGPVCRND